MNEQTKAKIGKIIFIIYVLVNTYVIFGFIWGYVPVDLGSNILRLPQNNLFSDSVDLFKFFQAITSAYLLYASFIGILGGLVSIGTRNIFEILALFWTGMLPRERKYWGVVFDQKTNKPISFVPVRLMKYTGDKSQLLQQTVTDSDGRYRLHVNQKSSKEDKDTRYVIEIHYPGYESVKQNIDQYLVIGNYELVSDFPLITSKRIDNRLKQWFYYNKPKLFNFLFLLIYYTYILFFILQIIWLINQPIFINIYSMIVITITLIWNQRIMTERSKPIIGKVLDADEKRPISTALVNLYGEEGKSISAITDNNGIVKLNVPSGVYRTLVSATGYVMLGADPKGLKVVKVGKDGYIDKDILLKKSEGEAEKNESNMFNPFN